MLALLLGVHGLAWDIPIRPNAVPDTCGRPMIVVARSHVDGSRHATLAVNALMRTHHRAPDLLVIVDDGWPEPKTATARFRMLEPLVISMRRFPFVGQWRYRDTISRPEQLPRKAVRALHEIETLAISATHRRRTEGA